MRARDAIAYTPLYIVLLTLVVAGGMLASLYVAFTTDIQRQLRDEVEADIDTVTAADTVLPAVTALTILDRQSDRDGKHGPLYLLLDPETRRPLAGNLPRWPLIDPVRNDCDEVADADGGQPMIACVTHLDGHFPLVVARGTGGIGDTRNRIWFAYSALAIVLMTAGTALGWIQLSSLRRRLAGIREALQSFAKGDLRARPAVRGEDLVGRLSAEIDRILGELQNAITGQHLIAERIAHDIKRPVAVAQAMLDLADPAADRLEQCREHIASLNQVIDGVLLISTIEARGDPPRPIALDSSVARIVDLYSGAAREKGVRIETALEPTIVSNRQELIDRLLSNLIGNAIKYTAPDSVVSIIVDRSGDRTELTIADQGPGLAGMPKQWGTYFARGPAGVGTEGWGIGLAQVRAIVERASGKIDFADRERGHGLVVTLSLPVDQATQA